LTRTRWIQYGALLAVAFVLSVGAGALIGRQRSAPPVASVPTPSPVVTDTATPTLAPATPTVAPTETPSHAPPTNPPTPPPTLPPTAPPVLDPPTAEEFAGDLLAAFQTGDTTYLFERLHPLNLERYGERQCRRYVNDLPPDPDASWTVLSSTGPAPWDWVTDDLTTTVQDAWTVTIEEPDERQREVHFAPFEGMWRWFTDCGDPR
jgi:hypothetical protein